MPHPIDRTTSRPADTQLPKISPKQLRTTAMVAGQAMLTSQFLESGDWKSFGQKMLGRTLWNYLVSLNVSPAIDAAFVLGGVGTPVLPTVITGMRVLTDPNSGVLKTLLGLESKPSDVPVAQRLAGLGWHFAQEAYGVTSWLGWQLMAQSDSAAALSYFRKVIIESNSGNRDMAAWQKQMNARANAISAYADAFKLEVSKTPADGAHRAIVEEIVKTALSDRESRAERLAALSALPNLGRAGEDVIAILATNAVRSEPDSESFLMERDALRAFAEMSELKDSLAWRSVTMNLAHELGNPENSVQRRRNAMALAKVLGQRGVRLVADATRLDNVDDLMSFGVDAADSIWNRMVIHESVRAQVLNLGSYELLFTILDVSRSDHRNEAARHRVVETLLQRHADNAESHPEISAVIAGGLSQFIFDPEVGALIRGSDRRLGAATIELLARDARGRVLLAQLSMDTSLPVETRNMARSAFSRLSADVDPTSPRENSLRREGLGSEMGRK